MQSELQLLTCIYTGIHLYMYVGMVMWNGGTLPCLWCMGWWYMQLPHTILTLFVQLYHPYMYTCTCTFDFPGKFVDSPVFLNTMSTEHSKNLLNSSPRCSRMLLFFSVVSFSVEGNTTYCTASNLMDMRKYLLLMLTVINRVHKNIFDMHVREIKIISGESEGVCIVAMSTCMCTTTCSYIYSVTSSDKLTKSASVQKANVKTMVNSMQRHLDFPFVKKKRRRTIQNPSMARTSFALKTQAMARTN